MFFEEAVVVAEELRRSVMGGEDLAPLACLDGIEGHRGHVTSMNLTDLTSVGPRLPRGIGITRIRIARVLA
jgi:hypothetical protein